MNYIAWWEIQAAKEVDVEYTRQAEFIFPVEYKRERVAFDPRTVLLTELELGEGK